MKPFKFKQFTIQQDKTAMKVGTDGVLLGAWAKISDSVDSILDIGTGTGLIALQMAQRGDCQMIDALEIEADAFEQAVVNFENSNWGDRLFCYHASLEEYVKEFDETYDLIISNPPFYNATYKELEPKRALARHTKNLTFEKLLFSTSKLLSKKGTSAFIIPYQEESKFLELAAKNKLFPLRITRVKGNFKTDFKRTLLQLGPIKTTPKINELVIEIERHVYTEEYKKLVEDFYL